MDILTIFIAAFLFVVFFVIGALLIYKQVSPLKRFIYHEILPNNAAHIERFRDGFPVDGFNIRIGSKKDAGLKRPEPVHCPVNLPEVVTTVEKGVISPKFIYHLYHKHGEARCGWGPYYTVDDEGPVEAYLDDGKKIKIRLFDVLQDKINMLRYVETRNADHTPREFLEHKNNNRMTFILLIVVAAMMLLMGIVIGPHVMSTAAAP